MLLDTADHMVDEEGNQEEAEDGLGVQQSLEHVEGIVESLKPTASSMETCSGGQDGLNIAAYIAQRH